uniref:Uncharacterized protein n=1 Tax=Cannabis sativa TaxID=3483 RepID=A0A803QFB2_CANSA
MSAHATELHHRLLQFKTKCLISRKNLTFRDRFTHDSFIVEHSSRRQQIYKAYQSFLNKASSYCLRPDTPSTNPYFFRGLQAIPKEVKGRLIEIMDNEVAKELKRDEICHRNLGEEGVVQSEEVELADYFEAMLRNIGALGASTSRVGGTLLTLITTPFSEDFSFIR